MANGAIKTYLFKQPKVLPIEELRKLIDHPRFQFTESLGVLMLSVGLPVPFVTETMLLESLLFSNWPAFSAIILLAYFDLFRFKMFRNDVDFGKNFVRDKGVTNPALCIRSEYDKLLVRFRLFRNDFAENFARYKGAAKIIRRNIKKWLQHVWYRPGGKKTLEHKLCFQRAALLQ